MGEMADDFSPGGRCAHEPETIEEIFEYNEVIKQAVLEKKREVRALMKTLIAPCFKCRHDGFVCDHCPQDFFKEFEAIKGKDNVHDEG